MPGQRILSSLVFCAVVALPSAYADECGRYAAGLATMAQAQAAVRGRVDYLAPPEDRVAARRLDQAALVERTNLDRFGMLLARCGWPRRSVEGEAALTHAWTLAQQGGANPGLQKAVVRRLEAAVAAGEAPGRHLAASADRLAVLEKRPQAYGTQLRPVGECGWDFYPLDNHARVEARRKALGLPPLEEQKRLGNEIVIHEHCGNPGRAAPPGQR